MVRARRCDPQGRRVVAQLPWDRRSDVDRAIVSGHEGMERRRAIARPGLTESIRQLNEKRKQSIAALDELEADVFGEEERAYYIGQINKRYEEDLHRVMREHDP